MYCKKCGQDNLLDASFCSNCGEALITMTKISPEIGVFASYGHGWQQLWKYFLELFLVGLIGFIIGIPSGFGGWGLGPLGNFLGFFGFIYSILVVWPVDYGISYCNLKAVRGERVEVKNMFAAFNYYGNAVLAALLVTIIVVIGFILLIIPGIIFACKLVFVPYLVVDRRMEGFEAIKSSWNMTNGHAWKVFLIYLLAIPIFLAGLICLGVGVIISILWLRTTLASLYYSVSTRAPSSG